MGYVHDKFSVFIPFTQFAHDAGVWTPTVESNVWFNRRTASDASATTYIPLAGVPQRDGGVKGAQLESVEVHFRIGTGALDAMEAHLYKATLGADSSLLTVAEVPTTYDAGHDTAAERIDVDEHLMALTPSSPEFLEDDEMLFVEVVYDAALGSVIDEFGAVANWTLRL